MDCIPGRATHHVLHIDNVGFYYGQCAEICGRYHHHMPVRICALPFEHFLLWWHTFGLSRLMYLRNDRQRFTKTYALRKYVW
jgi:heme/copper-type cytochrome/quinol oxidase subunit 2